MKDEKFFNEKLFQHTMPVRDGLWDKIESQLPPEKDRRAFPVFWFTLFATTLLSGTMMIGMLNNRTTEATKTSIEQTLPIPTHPFEQAPVQKETTANDVDLINNQSQVSLDSPTLDDHSSFGSNSSKNINRHSNKSKSPATTKSLTTTRLEESTATITLNPNKHNPTVENTPSISSPVKQSISPSTIYTPVSFLPLANQNVIDEKTLLPSIESMKPDPNCYKFGGIGSDYALSVDILAGPGVSPKTFEENGGEPGYADARKKTENNQYAWSAGARLNLHHRSGLTARLGLTYTQAGDLFDYTDSLATQSTTRIDSFFAADGTFLYTESSQVLILGTLIKKIHNTYRYLDIPLLVGLELPMGRSLLMVNIGPVLNLTSSHEGQILDPMFHPRSITEGDPGSIDVYKTTLGLSIYLGAGVVIPISDRISGIVEPSFLYRLKPVTLGNYPLNEHRHYAGLNLGIRYHLN